MEKETYCRKPLVDKMGDIYKLLQRSERGNFPWLTLKSGKKKAATELSEGVNSIRSSEQQAFKKYKQSGKEEDRKIY